MNKLIKYDRKYRYIRTSAGMAFESRYYANKFLIEVIEKLDLGYDYYEIFKDQDLWFINGVDKFRINIDDDCLSRL